MRPHDALDDALVLAQILKPALAEPTTARPGCRCARCIGAAGPTVRSPTTNCAAEDDRGAAALRVPEPGRFVAGRPLVQGMSVALSTEIGHTYEELIERILHAGIPTPRPSINRRRW